MGVTMHNRLSPACHRLELPLWLIDDPNGRRDIPLYPRVIVLTRATIIVARVLISHVCSRLTGDPYDHRIVVGQP